MPNAQHSRLNEQNANKMTEQAITTKRTDLFLIDPRNIVVVEGFNVRREFDLEELKEQIKDKGVLNPVTVIPFRDEHGVEKYKLVDGERRYRAVMEAIAEGAEIPTIKALKAPRDASLESLYIEQMMRNEGKRFTEYECAIMYKRFKDEFGYTQVEIAQKFHKSPAAISKCLSLLELPDYIREKVQNGELSVTAAKEITSNYFDEESQIEAARQAVHEARGQGKRATKRELGGELKAEKNALSLYNALIAIQDILGLKRARKVDLPRLSDLLMEHRDVEKALAAYKL